MRYAPRILSLSAAALLLAACGAGTEADQEPAAAPASPSASSSDGGGAETNEDTSATDDTDTDESDTDADESEGAGENGDSSDADDAGKDESSQDDAETAEGGSDDEGKVAPTPGGDAPVAAAHGAIWPSDDDWEITELDRDPCAQGGPSDSQYSDDPQVFTCGSTADSLLACMVEVDRTAVCITNPQEKKAVTFQIGEQYGGGVTVEQTGTTLPLIARLAGGANCYPQAHDQAEHWNGMSSWYTCDDGSELLTDESIGNTFAYGDTGIIEAERSATPGEEPEPVALEAHLTAGYMD